MRFEEIRKYEEYCEWINYTWQIRLEVKHWYWLFVKVQRQKWKNLKAKVQQEKIPMAVRHKKSTQTFNDFVL